MGEHNGDRDGRQQGGLLADILDASVTQGQPPADASPEPSFSQADDLLQLGDRDLQVVVSELELDSLLTLLASGSEDLRRRVLSKLGEESVQYVRDNLAYIDEVTERARRDAEAELAELAGRLLRAGKIASREVEAVAQEQTRQDALLELFERLLAARAAGDAQAVEALASQARSRGLMAALDLLEGAPDLDTLETRLDALLEGLLELEKSRLRVVREGVLALRRGDSPELFRKRMR